MSVSDAGSDDFFATTVGEVGNGGIDTELVLIGKLDSHIDDDHLIFVFESHTVESHLFHTTEGYDAKSLLRKWFGTFFFVSEVFFECLSRCEKWIGSFWFVGVFEEK